MPNSTPCELCLKPKANLTCGLCKKVVCKNCEEFLEPDYFSFWEKPDQNLLLAHFCAECFCETIGPIKEKYDSILNLAKEINIFFAADPHPPHPIRKHHKLVSIKDCVDRDESILRLAFRAVELGYNSLMQVTTTAKQVRNHAHQKNVWDATGLPAEIDLEKYFKRYNP
jgi:hypothetical protein